MTEIGSEYSPFDLKVGGRILHSRGFEAPRPSVPRGITKKKGKLYKIDPFSRKALWAESSFTS